MKQISIKLAALTLCIALLATTLAACGSGNSSDVDRDEYDRIMEENRQMREQLGEPAEPSSTSSPTNNITRARGVTAVNNGSTTLSLGYGHSAVITADGDLYIWGKNELSEAASGIQPGTSTADIPLAYTASPTKVPGLDNVVAVNLGSYHRAAITDDGNLYTWGYNGYIQLGRRIDGDQHIPAIVPLINHIAAVNLAETYSAAVTDGGDLYIWGGMFKQSAWKVSSISNVAAVGISSERGLVVTEDGDLYTWSSVDTANMKKVQDLSNVVAVSAGEYCRAAITADGSLYTWGNNRFDQLGVGAVDFADDPAKVPGLENVIAVSIGGTHSAAITADGTLYTWGYNDGGQLGLGDTENRSTPEKVPNLSNVVAVSLGYAHSAAITADGTLYTWGTNTDGELGDGTTENRVSPIKIMGGVMLPDDRK